MACTRTEFDDKVLFDLGNFVENRVKKSVLVFPALNSYFRFVIHRIIEGNFKGLFTFSIGQEPNRRIVVCPKNILSSDYDSQSIGLKAAPTAQPTVQQKTMVVGPDEPIASTQPKKSRTILPTAQIYRPPAARRSENEATLPPPPIAPSGPPIQETKPKARVRRPDIQVYIPRAKRASVENANSKGESTANYILPDGNDTSKGRLLKGRSQSPVTVRSRASVLVETKKKLCQSSSSSDVEYEVDKFNSSEPATMADVRRDPKLSSSANLPPRAEALVEMKKRLCQMGREQDNLEPCPKLDVPSVQGRIANDSLLPGEVQTRLEADSNVASDPLFHSENVHCAVIGSEVTRNDEKCNTERIDEEMVKDCSQDNGMSSKANISEVLPNSDSSNLELPLYSSGYTSDSPPSSESGSSHSLSSMESCDVSNKSTSNKESVNKSKKSPVFNPDECDWDDLLDENGECLDPFLMKELTDAVGDVRVARPQSDYNEYRSQAPADGRSYRQPDEDFGHVLEIYSFPPEFKTQDLMAVFLPFKNVGGGFEIKWVDDTHALGVFSSSLVAAEVLQYQHPLVRTRPLSEGIQESRLKAVRLAKSIQSFKPRPATCAALARRLVTGALGVKLKTARQEREEEKKVLQEAREKRRLAAKQREEIWND